MTDVSAIPVDEVVPHDAPMVLIDRILSFEESSLVAEVDIRTDTMFCDATGVPGWVGLEYMAQAVAAHAGMQARLRGEPPRIGFLLGTRAYRCDVESFAVGEQLIVHIEPLFVEMGLGAFACRIDTDRTVATAKINVYQPEDDGSESLATGRIS